jgi:hypothetical protein
MRAMPIVLAIASVSLAATAADRKRMPITAPGSLPTIRTRQSAAMTYRASKARMVIILVICHGDTQDTARFAGCAMMGSGVGS